MANLGHRCQPKAGRSCLGGYEWFVCYGSRSDEETPSEVDVHDWTEYLHILAAFCRFLLAWLLLCAWPRPIGLLAATYFVAWLVAWRECLFAFPMLGVGGS